MLPLTVLVRVILATAGMRFPEIVAQERGIHRTAEFPVFAAAQRQLVRVARHLHGVA